MVDRAEATWTRSAVQYDVPAGDEGLGFRSGGLGGGLEAVVGARA